MAQVTMLIFLGGIIFLVGPDEAGTCLSVYRHMFIPIALITGLCLLFSPDLASQILKPLQEKSKYGEYLKETEMFQIRGTRLPLSSRALTRAFFSLTNLLASSDAVAFASDCHDSARSACLCAGGRFDGLGHHGCPVVDYRVRRCLLAV